MDKNEKKITWIQYFVDLLEKNNIWYSIIKDSLFEYATKSKKEKFRKKYLDVIMTLDAYEKLLTLKPEYIINAVDLDDYVYLHQQFMPSLSNRKEKGVINIYIIVPTTPQKIQTFIRYKNQATYVNLLVKHLGQEKLTKKQISIYKKSRLFPFHPRNINYKDVYNMLFEKKFTCYFIISSPFETAEHNWISNISFKREVITYMGVKVKVMKEWKPLLNNQYEEELVEITRKYAKH